jgi:hypothetical protein
MHPGGELAGKRFQRCFGARDRIVGGRSGRDRLAQCVRRRNHFMIRISRDRGRIVLAGGHAGRCS